MEARHIAYIVYIILMFTSSAVLASADIYVNNWRLWVITACVIGAYFCGMFSGVVK